MNKSSDTPRSSLLDARHHWIAAKLGQGGMGAVYRATDKKLDREVAIEVLPERMAQSKERLARFELEPPSLPTLDGFRNTHIMPFDHEATADQHAVLRRMTPEQRWRAARQLYWTMRRHKAAFLKSRHPEWSQEHIEQEVRSIFLHARS